MTTSSDWVEVGLVGLSSFTSNATITLGDEAPGLQYSYSPGRIWIAKKQFDVTPVSIEVLFLAIKGVEEGQISIISGALGETGVDVYSYSGYWNLIFSVKQLGSDFVSPTSNKHSYTIDYSHLYASPSGTADIEGVPSNLSKKVFAFYYPWYGNPIGPSDKIYHWNSPIVDTPYLGNYDSYDESVIKAQIEMAKAAGIDGFIVSWWGPGTFEDGALPHILKVAEELNFTITIYYESYRGSTTSTILTPDYVALELSDIVKKYSNSSAFLKADGAPVIFVYAVGALDRSQSYWVDVRSLLKERVGPTYLIGDLLDPKYAEAFDGCHTYASANSTQASEAFNEFSNFMKFSLNGVTFNQAITLIDDGEALPLKERFLAYTVEPGYDLTKTGGTNFLNRQGGKTYDTYWKGALSSSPDAVLITTWNEWHEGSEIEPSIEYGFTYVNMTRQLISTYKGSSSVIGSTNLGMSSTISDVLRQGKRNASILLTDNSSNPAIDVNLTLNLGGGLSLLGIHRSKFYSYVEENSSNSYHVTIPLLEPGETLTFNATLSATLGSGEFKSSAICFSAYGVPSKAHFEKQVQVVSDRVNVNLSTNSSRVEVGSEAKIIVSAKYEYDGQPLVGEAYLNDTLMKNSTCTCTYTTRGVSDKLHGLTDFTTNTVTVTFDRIMASESMDSLSPGSVTPSIKLIYESDGQPVDKATVTVNGVPLTEITRGIYRATIATWGPYSQLSIHLEQLGFTPQNLTLSGILIGNFVVEVMLVAIALVAVLLFAKAR